MLQNGHGHFTGSAQVIPELAGQNRPPPGGHFPKQVQSPVVMGFVEVIKVVQPYQEASPDQGGEGRLPTALQVRRSGRFHRAGGQGGQPVVQVEPFQLGDEFVFQFIDLGLEAGQPDNKDVFGITGLEIISLSSDENTAVIQANYTLWLPAAGADAPAGAPADANKEGDTAGKMTIQDSLVLQFQKGEWRITGIERTSTLR